MKPITSDSCWLVGLAAAALLMLAACDSGSSDTAAPTETPSANASADASAPANTTPVISGASADLGTGPEGLIGDKLAGILGGDDRHSAALAATQAAALPNGQKVTWQGTSNATSNPATGWAHPIAIRPDAAAASSSNRRPMAATRRAIRLKSATGPPGGFLPEAFRDRGDRG